MTSYSKNGPAWREGLAGDMTLRYLVAGTGEPIILLHGLAGSARWWRYNFAPLSASFRVYAIELMRFGGHHPRPKFVLREMGERIAAWMDAEGIKKARFVGHSMGGYIAASLAVSHPELVHKLVLVGAALFPQLGTKLSPKRLLQWLPQFPLDLAAILLKDAWWTTPVQIWETARDLLQSNLTCQLSLIRCPTLIIWGNQDGILPVEMASALKTQINDSVLEIFDGIGHCPMWEAPARFNSEVRRFLSK